MLDRRLSIAANNGDIGGGEVMLLHLADAARELGLDVEVVGPRWPGTLIEQAAAHGFRVQAVAGRDRASYARALRSWDRRRRSGLLWCNGLVPAFATAGHRDRVVHLHQAPDGPQRAIRVAATRGARAVLVPSRSMRSKVPGSEVLLNWTTSMSPRPSRAISAAPTIGFLGRLTPDKGVHVLAQAVRQLRAEGVRARLLLAGEARFGSATEARTVETALAPLGGAVERVGWIERDELFDRVDLAVFPSTWEEPFGLVAAESMACRVPFVVSDAGALPEVVGPDYPWTARAKDPHHLADVIRTVLASETADRTRVTAEARERWEKLFSPQAGRSRLGAVLARA